MIPIKLKTSKKMTPFLALLMLASAVFAYFSTSHQSVVPNLSASEVYQVERAVDGDTLKLSNGDRVRLIGIDTPESSANPKLYRDASRTGKDVQTILAMGQEAKDFTRKLVEGKFVHLETDSTPRDKYGRLLAYVFLEDKTFVNAEIVRAGYAHVYTIPPNVKYQKLFIKLQNEAREKRRGLWT